MYTTSVVDTVLLNNYDCIIRSSIVSCTAELQVLCQVQVQSEMKEMQASANVTFLEIRGLQAKGLAGNWEVREIAAMANAC
jgi:hypothetical protein